uniref:G-patch domain-containing protein n=1 Tax=Solanum tuberosum TaxID=4113 RepID=M1DUN5_SOLTU
MVTLDEEYEGPDYPNVDEADAMTSSVQPVITVQLKELTNELDRAIFHTLEIMQVVWVNEEVEPDDTKLSSAAKMVASEMLNCGYQPKSGLGPKSNGIVEPI